MKRYVIYMGNDVYLRTDIATGNFVTSNLEDCDKFKFWFGAFLIKSNLKYSSKILKIEFSNLNNLKKNYRFIDWFNKNKQEDNLLPPPLSDKKAILFLKEYLLGEDWYVNYSASAEQINTEIVYAILEKYSKKFKKEIKRYQRK